MGELSLQAMMNFFADHPELVTEYCWRNDRTAFFLEAPGGPFGSINVPVTPWRTVATDKEVFPRASVAFLSTRVPVFADEGVRLARYRAFALDQDTGGAIRAAGRCDLYMGVGENAAALAGRTGAEGKLYYIFIRPGLMPGVLGIGGINEGAIDTPATIVNTIAATTANFLLLDKWNNLLY